LLPVVAPCTLACSLEYKLVNAYSHSVASEFIHSNTGSELSARLYELRVCFVFLGRGVFFTLAG